MTVTNRESTSRHRQVAIWSCPHLYFHIMHISLNLNTMHVLQKFCKILLLSRALGSRLTTMLGRACTNGWVENQTSFKQINLPSFGAMFCENFWKPKLYTILLLRPGRNGIDGSVYKWLRPSGSCSECARLGSCTQVFGGDCRPGDWDLPSKYSLM